MNTVSKKSLLLLMFGLVCLLVVGVVFFKYFRSSTPVSASDQKMSCPNTIRVDCSNTTGMRNPNCHPAYLQWAKTNCPKFEGASY